MPGWPVRKLCFLGLEISAAVAVIDAVLGHRVILIVLLIAGPCCVLLTGRWIPTGLTGAWVISLAVVLGLPDGIWLTRTHLTFLAAVTAVAIISTLAAALIREPHQLPFVRVERPGRQVRAAVSSQPRHVAGRRGFDYLLEAGEVGGDRGRVAGELLVGHVRLASQREHDLAAVAVPGHPHRVVEDLAGRQGDVVVEHAVVIDWRELEADLAARGLHEPLAVDLLDRAAQSGRPLRQVGRIASVGIDLVDVRVDQFAELSGFGHHRGGQTAAVRGSGSGPVRAEDCGRILGRIGAWRSISRRIGVSTAS